MKTQYHSQKIWVLNENISTRHGMTKELLSKKALKVSKPMQAITFVVIQYNDIVRLAEDTSHFVCRI